MTNTAIIPFHDSALRCAEVDGIIYVAVKPICEHIGFSWQGQRAKLVSDDRFSCRVIRMTAEDGKKHEMICLPQEQLIWWVMDISPKKVPSEQGKALKLLKEGVIRAALSASTHERLLAPLFEPIEKSRPTEGYVYFMHCKETNSVKIGFSTDVEARIRAINCGRASHVELLGHLSGTQQLEAQLHVQFADFRTKGEWFEARPIVLRGIRKLLKSEVAV